MDQQREIHESGLQVFPINNNHWGIRYSERYPFPKGIPYTDFCSIVDDNSKAHPKKVFDNTIKIINPQADLKDLRKQLREQMSNFIPNETCINKDTSEEKEMELLKETDFNEIKPTELEEIISIVILGSKYKLKNRPSLIMILLFIIPISEHIRNNSHFNIFHFSV